jgi:uncharacterized protein
LQINTPPIIQTYGDGGFTLNNIRYDGSIVIHTSGVSLWPISQLSITTLADFNWAMNVLPCIEFLIVGSGKLFMPLASDIRTLLRTKGISVDVMDTGAACRTYNVLSNEGRRVAAALVAQ